MANPQPPSGWENPATTGQPPPPPADPTLPMGGPSIPSQPSPADPYAGASQPAGIDPYAVPGYYAPPMAYPPYGYPPAPRTNGLAIAALVLALTGLASCITAPVGAILGHVARRQIRERGEGGDGMAKAAIIVGWILTGLMIVVIIGYIALIVYAINNPDTFDTSGDY